MISPNEAAEKARKIIADCPNDTETVHIGLDDLLIEIVRDYGYGELADIYENTYKWYA